MAKSQPHEKILRSQEWFGSRDLEGFLHRAGLKNQGWSEESFAGLDSDR